MIPWVKRRVLEVSFKRLVRPKTADIACTLSKDPTPFADESLFDCADTEVFDSAVAVRVKVDAAEVASEN